MLANPDRELSADEEEHFRSLVDRRLRAEPVAYLLGEKEFYGRPFMVDRRVLVPRPETEHLVTAVLDRLPASGATILDVGTGSGCIAITLALESPSSRICANDISIAALALAAENRDRLGARVTFYASTLLDSLGPTPAEVVVANLPYIDQREAVDLSPEVRDWEPPTALFAAEGGLRYYRGLFAQASLFASGALFFLEVGAGQAQATVELAAQYDLHLVERIFDYAGHQRVLVLRTA